MKKSILFCITSLLATILYGQGNKLDLTNLRKKEVKDDNAGIIAKYYDNRDSLVYEVTYDLNRKIVDGDFGIAVVKHTYDARGDRTETRYFNKEMKAVRVEDGPAIIKRKYDQNHRLVEEGNYYENGTLVVSNSSVFQFKYDDRGFLIEKIKLNQDRQPSAKISIRKYKVDEHGKMIEEFLFDKNNKLVKTGGDVEYSSTRFEYSDDGRVIKKTFLTEAGELIDGKAIVKIVYDKRPPGKSFIDQYDDNPKWIQLTYFDKFGKEIEQEYQYITKDDR